MTSHSMENSQTCEEQQGDIRSEARSHDELEDKLDPQIIGCVHMETGVIDMSGCEWRQIGIRTVLIQTGRNANEDSVVCIGGKEQRYDFRPSIGVLPPYVSFQVCCVCIYVPTVLHIETEFPGRMQENVPGVADVTLILHLSLMVLQSFCTRK